MTLFAATTERTFYEFTRVHMMSEWWHWLALLSTCIVVAIIVAIMYRRDSVDLGKGTRGTLLLLRILAFVGLAFFFLNLEKKTEQRQTKNSRVAVLVDVSQSMGITDMMGDGTREAATRIEQVLQHIADGEVIRALREKHDVSVYTFSDNSTPASVASYQKVKASHESTQVDPKAVVLSAAKESRNLWTAAAIAIGIAMVAVFIHFFLGNRGRGAEGESWFLLIATVVAIVGFVFAGVANLRQPSITPAMAFGWRQLPDRLDDVRTPKIETKESATETQTVDWNQVLAARGVETRVGDAIQSIVEQERGGPISGVVVITDGASNSGLGVAAIAEFAKQADVAVFPVGVGSSELPRNVRVVDMEAPARVFPGDNFTVKAYLQASGIPTHQVSVQLLSADTSTAVTNETPLNEQQKEITLSADNVVTVDFEVTPDQVGKRLYSVKVQSIPGEINEADNVVSASVEIIERKNRVLLFAGGPTREYRFLRNQLFRDKETVVDILLQTAVDSTAQESNNLLEDFPESPDAMFEYDCLIAFDPDWSQLSSEQLQLVERWVAEKAGGMIAIAGPVHMPDWTRGNDVRLTPIRSLYPVTFFSRIGASIQIGRSKSDTPWPPQLTDAGRAAPFMNLAEDDTKSPTAAWDDFEGVYAYYATKDAKPGATVYAYFSDPQTAVNDVLPVYLADQFYGAGRVAFLASGEMWRLRAEDDAYFQRFYTKLIRHVSQGRLSRDSSRGVLLADKERCVLGETVSVRAVLSNAQFEPLAADKVAATIVQPNGLRQPLTLLPAKQEAREGVFNGQFTALSDGNVVVELVVPESNNEVLKREIRVRVPQLEIEKPQRNDAELAALADTTRGKYFVGLAEAFDDKSDSSLYAKLPVMDQQTYMPGTTDDAFQQRLMTWLLALITGALCLEWIIRRLSKLA
ncbi:MAG: hypothetical protein KDB27_10205 [Planctomycetales bacterium]|nr:hypothetical protein [Planctomycetales bacterium]